MLFISITGMHGFVQNYWSATHTMEALIPDRFSRRSPLKIINMQVFAGILFTYKRVEIVC